MKIRAIAVALALTAGWGYAASSVAQESKPTVTVYKTATCGCCSKWIEHMRTNGFEVKSTDMPEVTSVKTSYGVPTDAASCHTALVGGYVVEGHVPASAVKKLLKEKPKVVGIAVPGMPVGSPGMEVPSGEVEAYNVVSFDKSGKMTVFEKH
jgi:hypothetical protein